MSDLNIHQEAFIMYFLLLATGQLHIMEGSRALVLDPGPPQTCKMNYLLAYTSLCFICNKQAKNYNQFFSFPGRNPCLPLRVREGLREKKVLALITYLLRVNRAGFVGLELQLHRASRLFNKAQCLVCGTMSPF